MDHNNFCRTQFKHWPSALAPQKCECGTGECSRRSRWKTYRSQQSTKRFIVGTTSQHQNDEEHSGVERTHFLGHSCKRIQPLDRCTSSQRAYDQYNVAHNVVKCQILFNHDVDIRLPSNVQVRTHSCPSAKFHKEIDNRIAM